MVSSFILQNQTTKESASFGQDLDFDFVFKSDGLDWGDAQATHNTYSYPTQVGSYIASTSINERSISIIGYAFYILEREKINELGLQAAMDEGYNRILQQKKLLNELINPQDYVRIIIGNFYIDGKPSRNVVFGKSEEDNNIFFCKFAVDIFCNNPMFKKTTVTKNVLSGDIPQFHFPLVFTPKGIVMSKRKEYHILAVENEGSVPVGGNIIFEASGEVKTPMLENVNTGEFVKINKTMQKGERIVISTVDGREKGVKGTIGGIEENYFKYWDFENTWIKFPVGASLFGYSTGNGKENLLNVSVEINPEKFALEEM